MKRASGSRGVTRLQCCSHAGVSQVQPGLPASRAGQGRGYSAAVGSKQELVTLLHFIVLWAS
jgi:hypothetical protein